MNIDNETKKSLDEMAKQARNSEKNEETVKKEYKDINMDIPKRVKRCTNNDILKKLYINKVSSKNYHFNELISDIRILNPDMTINLLKNSYSKIFVDYDLVDIVLPEPFYFDENGVITNKGANMDGYTLNCQVDGISNINRKTKKETSTKERTSKEKCLRKYTIEELIKELKETNPNVDFVMKKDGSDNTLYISENISKIKLPTGFYYNSKNGITNKHNSIDGLYIALDYAPINKYFAKYGQPASADLTRKKQHHRVKLSRVFSKVEKYFIRKWDKMVAYLKDLWNKIPFNKKDYEDFDYINDGWSPIEEEKNTKDEHEPINNNTYENDSPMPEIDKLVVIEGEIEELTNKFQEELKKGAKADVNLLKSIHNKIEELRILAKEERIKSMKSFGEEIDYETTKEEKESKKESYSLSTNVLPKSEPKEIYPGYSINALEYILNKVEVVNSNGRVFVRDKETKQEIKDKNIFLKYQMACIWKSINEKLNRNPFSKESKYEFNYMLVSAVNSLSAADYIDVNLINEAMHNVFKDSCVASDIALSNSQVVDLLNTYASYARSLPVADIDKTEENTIKR